MAAKAPRFGFVFLPFPFCEASRRITAGFVELRAQRGGRRQGGFWRAAPAATTSGRRPSATATTIASFHGDPGNFASGCPPCPTPFQGQRRSSTTTLVLAVAASAAATGGLCVWLYVRSRGDNSPFPPMHPHEFRPFALTSKTPVSPTVALFRFTYPPGQEMTVETLARLPVCSVLLVKDDTCQIARPYTPLTIDEKGFEIAVKRYEDGQASRFLHDVCRVGRMVEFRGPLQCAWFGEENGDVERTYGMIAGGTGITPMYQIIKHYFARPDKGRGKHVKISLVYAATSPAELFLRKELDVLAAAYPDQLKVTYLVDSVSQSDDITPELLGVRVGRLTNEIVRECMPPSAGQGPAPIILVCGPDPMLRYVAGDRPQHTNINHRPDPLDSSPAGGLLGRAGYCDSQIFKF